MTKILLGIAAIGCVTSSAVHAGVIADWTFEISKPTTAGAFTPEVGSGSALSVHANATTVYSSPVGNDSAQSFSSTKWGVGDYYEFDVAGNSTGMSIAFDHVGSATGPGSFQVEYATASTPTIYTNLTNGGYSVAGTSANWTSTKAATDSSFSFLLPDNIVSIRLVDTSATASGGGAVGTSGTDRVDNVVISGTAVPEPASLGLLALGGASLLTRRRK